ncbi:hypothetical protein C8R42DRAFT_61524 [Lentinula raphanica]|nr:hypothetical protein C8R42DRAFT_61524 [Lentinula raphanica]
MSMNSSGSRTAYQFERPKSIRGMCFCLQKLRKDKERRTRSDEVKTSEDGQRGSTWKDLKGCVSGDGYKQG